MKLAFWRKMTTETVKLQVMLTKELKEQIEARATAENLTVSDLVRNSLTASLATPVTVQAVPAHVPTPVVTPEKAKEEGPIFGRHSCAYFDPKLPPMLRNSGCQGVCHNPRQEGRACHHGSNVARHCFSYRAFQAR